MSGRCTKTCCGGKRHTREVSEKGIEVAIKWPLRRKYDEISIEPTVGSPVD